MLARKTYLAPVAFDPQPLHAIHRSALALLCLNPLQWPYDPGHLQETKLRGYNLIYVLLLLPQLDTSISSFEGGISRLLGKQ